MGLPAFVEVLRTTPPVNTSIRVEMVTDDQAFIDLAPVWDRVAEAAGLDHPFLEHAWVRTWWACFGAGSQLRVLVLKSSGETIAIAPLILTTVRMWGINVRRLGFFYNAHVPRFDFLITQRHDEVYRAIWDHLARRRDWDLLQLCQLPSGCATLDAIPRLAKADGCGIVRWQSCASPYLSLASSWSEYFDTLASKHRANLKNRLKRLKGIGTLSAATVDAAEQLPFALPDALKLEAAGWKGKTRTAISFDPNVAAFYSKFADVAAARGWLKLHFLESGSTRIAFDYSLAYKRRTYLLKVGYDPAYAPYSPSNLLLLDVLQQLLTDGGGVEYDFLGDAADWKSQWTGLSRAHYWLSVFRPSAKGKLLYAIKAKLIPLLQCGALRPLRRLMLRATGATRTEKT